MTQLVLSWELLAAGWSAPGAPSRQLEPCQRVFYVPVAGPLPLRALASILRPKASPLGREVWLKVTPLSAARLWLKAHLHARHGRCIKVKALTMAKLTHKRRMQNRPADPTPLIPILLGSNKVQAGGADNGPVQKREPRVWLDLGALSFGSSDRRADVILVHMDDNWRVAQPTFPGAREPMRSNNR
jgi:hypothetical protein